ncbi:MAG: hypothetical protein PHC34_08375 [Candidatus Gastranaerophilales bacterium]|nr:hypothetical protein [Candidatus Gastranaerophilales bacterium]
MKVVTNQNFTNYQAKSNVNNSLAFKANLISTPAAKEQLKKGLLDLYENGDPLWFYESRGAKASSKEPFDFETFYENLKKMLESTTRRIKGTIELIAGKEEKPTIQFITPQNKVYKTSDCPGIITEIQPAEIIKNGKPRINTIIAKLADLESCKNNYNDYSEAFSNLFNRIIKKEYGHLKSK